MEIGEIVSSLAKIPGVEMLIRIFQIAGIAAIIYVSFLIVRGIYQYRYVSRISSISKNVSELNEKMDILISEIKKTKKKNK